MPERESNEHLMKSIGPFLTLGIQLALGVVILFFAGRWLDEKLGTSPWLMLAGVFIGSAGGIIKFVMTATKIGREEDAAK